LPVLEHDIVTKEFIQIVKNGAAMSVSDQLKDLIRHDRASDEKMDMFDGHRYYRGEHDILEKQRVFYNADKQQQVDETKVNNRAVNNFPALLTDQKIHYLLGSNPKWTVETDLEREVVNFLFNKRFWKKLRQYVKHTSNHGKSYLHPFADSNSGDFKSRVMDGRELIVIKDPDFEDEIQQVIRYYEVQHITGVGDDLDTESRLSVQWYMLEGVWYFIETDGGDLVIDLTRHSLDENNMPVIVSYLEKGMVTDEGFVVTETGNWGRLPFIELCNNDECTPDLNRIRSLVDAYNAIESGFLDLNGDVSEIIKVIRGALDTSAHKLAENLRYFRVVGVEGDGGIDGLVIDIPYRAKREILNRLREDIYAFGQGVDMTTDRFGRSPSGVSLQFLYEPLEEKANDLITGLEIAFEEYIELYEVYLKFARGTDISVDAEFTFSKTMITNKAEEIGNVQRSKDIVSQRTNLRHHPFVSNVDEELKQIEVEENERGSRENT